LFSVRRANPVTDL